MDATIPVGAGDLTTSVTDDGRKDRLGPWVSPARCGRRGWRSAR